MSLQSCHIALISFRYIPSPPACRLLQGRGQGLQEALPAPQRRTEARQMVCVHLTVDEVKIPGLEVLHEVGMVWEEGVLPERSERFGTISLMYRGSLYV
jgi:hypothetical protein